MDKAVKQIFDSYPEHIKPKMLHLRKLILNVALNETHIGPLEETLKWGEPSYLTNISKSGTTIRIDWKSKSPAQYALYVNCKTTLIDSYRSLFPELRYDGNRAIMLDIDEKLPEEQLRICISMALNYHLSKP